MMLIFGIKCKLRIYKDYETDFLHT
jgi:hypothetical protein